jgi:hypothetical protein
VDTRHRQLWLPVLLLDRTKLYLIVNLLRSCEHLKPFTRCRRRWQKTPVSITFFFFLLLSSPLGWIDPSKSQDKHQYDITVDTILSWAKTACSLLRLASDWIAWIPFPVLYLIYLSTVIGLTPGGSTHLHINNTWNITINKKTTRITKKQHKQQIGKRIGRAQSLLIILWHLPYNWGKSTEKPQSG